MINSFERLLFIIGFILLIFFLGFLRKKKKAASRSINFQSKMEVDLEKCEVIESSTTSHISEPNILDPGWLTEMTNMPNPTNSNQNVVRLKCIIDDFVYVSEPVMKDKVTVLALMMMKKTTSIYFNQKKSDQYFFDVHFLKE